MKNRPQRIKYIIVLVMIICLGLLSRNLNGPVTEIIDVKDVLWAMMVYFLVRIVFLHWKIIGVSVFAMTFSVIIEASQLYHAEWIDSMRNTFLGAIILGTSFVWADLYAYGCGVLLSMLTDYLIKKVSGT